MDYPPQRIKTKQLIFDCSLVTGLSDRASGPPKKLQKIRKEKTELGDPCSVSAGFQSSGSFTDNTRSNKAEELVNEIASRSFCLGWQLSYSHCFMAQGCPSLTGFCGFLSTFTVSHFLNYKKKKIYIYLSIFFLCICTLIHTICGHTVCVVPAACHWQEEERGLDRDKQLISPNWSWAAHISSLILELNYLYYCWLRGSDLDAAGWCMNYCNEQYLSSYFFPLPRCFFSLRFFSVCRNNLASW